MSVEVQEKTEEILVEGFCILRNRFPKPAIEACNEAFASILRDYVAEHADNPNRGPCRHYITLPFEPPLYNPCFFNDDTVIAIASQVLGEDFAIDQYASDTPLKGSVYQEIHGDVGPLFPENPDFQHPPAILAVNFPFIDVTPAHGPFEIARGTHLLSKAEALRRIEDGEIPLEPLLMNAGDVLIRDPRCLHRGTPNHTDTPRPVAVFACLRGWMQREHRERNPVPESVWAGFSEREKQLMRKLPRTPSTLQ